jgi:drug/metabolite transporter (DMT)-like permease
MASRLAPYLLLVLANLCWSGNWVTGRAIRGSFEPLGLCFWRWAIALAVLAPFVLPRLRRVLPALRRSWGLLLLLSFTGLVAFQSLVYLGLRSTTAVNAVLLNATGPLFVILCSWALDGETASRRRIAGMLVSFVGVFVILSGGHARALLHLDLGIGDAWILLAMLLWGLYSVLLRRLPRGLDGSSLLFVLAALAVAQLLPLYLLEAVLVGEPAPTLGAAAAVVYVGVFASVIAFMAWNDAVARLGAHVAGFSMHLMPAFGTILAILVLGESLRPYHLVGFAAILAGVLTATAKGRRQLPVVVESMGAQLERPDITQS